VPEAHAETGVMDAARALRSMPTAAALPLGISMGTVRGMTRRAPRFWRVS